MDEKEIKYLKFAPNMQRGKLVTVSAWYPSNPAIQGYGNSEREAKIDLLQQIADTQSTSVEKVNDDGRSEDRTTDGIGGQDS
jgi:hypothetical protein